MTIEQDMQLQFEAERFLYREADLLDRQMYREWLELLTEDATYFVPAIESVEHRHRSFNQVGDEGHTAYFEDTRKTLEMRVARLGFPGAWAEVPPSRTKHYITNIVASLDAEGHILVKSNFMIFRSRLESEEDHYYGGREDLLLKEGDKFKLFRRRVVLAQSVMTARSITTFF